MGRIPESLVVAWVLAVSPADGSEAISSLHIPFGTLFASNVRILRRGYPFLFMTLNTIIAVITLLICSKSRLSVIS